MQFLQQAKKRVPINIPTYRLWLTFYRVVNHTTIISIEKWHCNRVGTLKMWRKKIEYFKQMQHNSTINFTKQCTTGQTSSSVFRQAQQRCKLYVIIIILYNIHRIQVQCFHFFCVPSKTYSELCVHSISEILLFTNNCRYIRRYIKVFNLIFEMYVYPIQNEMFDNAN